jgi:hypothetical protein
MAALIPRLSIRYRLWVHPADQYESVVPPKLHSGHLAACPLFETGRRILNPDINATDVFAHVLNLMSHRHSD